MYMNIKAFTKNERELEFLMQTIKIYSQDVGMEFGIEKCAMLMIKSGKREIAGGIGLPNQENNRTFGEKKNYKYLIMLKPDTIKRI